MSKAKWITVYASSSNAVGSHYFQLARDLGALLGSQGFHLIYGASNIGLMGTLAQAVKDNGGHVHGVIPQKIHDHVPPFREIDNLTITDTMAERKNQMIEQADAFIALPGGFGTLEELMEVITLKQLQYHEKAIVIMNPDGFYDNLLAHFDLLYHQKFAKSEYRDLFHIAKTPQDALDYIKNYQPGSFGVKWTDLATSPASED